MSNDTDQPQLENIPLGIYDSLTGAMAGINPDWCTPAKGFEARYALSTYEIEAAMRWDGVMENYLTRASIDSLANPLDFLNLEDPELTRFTEWLQDIGFYDALIEADIARARTGFAAVWMDTGAVDTANPLRVGELARLKKLVVYDADCMNADQHRYAMHEDPTIWRMTDPTLQAPPEIHASRLLIFQGRSPSRRALYTNGGKGESDAARIWMAWSNWLEVNGMSPAIAKTYEEPTLAIKGLNQALMRPDGEKGLKSRLTDFGMARRAYRINAIDAEDRYERPGPPIAGLGDIYDRQESFFLAQTAWPRSILFGNLKGGSLGGAEASKGEEQEWNKKIARHQRLHFMKPITQFFNLAKESLFRGLNLAFEFPPLHQHSDKEWAEIELLRAQRDKIYAADIDGIERVELRKKLKADKVYPDIDPEALPEITPEPGDDRALDLTQDDNQQDNG